MTGTQPEISDGSSDSRRRLPWTETIEDGLQIVVAKSPTDPLINMVLLYPPKYEGASEMCHVFAKHAQATVRCALAESPLLQASPQTAAILARDSEIAVRIMLAKSAHITSYPHALSILIEDFKTAALAQKERAHTICWALAANRALSQLPEIVLKLRELNDLKINAMLDQNHALAPRTEPQPEASV